VRYPVSMRATALAVVVSKAMVIAPVYAGGEGEDAAAVDFNAKSRRVQPPTALPGCRSRS